jgi:2-polyprenyl-6-hydroxyphenyl methylase/3-demethylubiquinone-9 3-methyltransferase
MTQTLNVDPAELAKFSDLAHRWWDPESEFRPLHQINPLRLEWINGLAPLAGQRVLDVGCGGGILADAMARKGAEVLGIDLSSKSLKVAQLHALEAQTPGVAYREVSAEALAAEQAGSFDVVTCMEMLEHVPDPASIVRACATLVKPGGWVFFSTLNRNPKSFLFAIVGAEYVLNLLPRGTHEYAKMVRPSELAGHCRAAGLDLQGTRGMQLQPADPALLAQQRHQRQLPVCHPQSRRRGLKHGVFDNDVHAVLFDLDGTLIDSAPIWVPLPTRCAPTGGWHSLAAGGSTAPWQAPVPAACWAWPLAWTPDHSGLRRHCAKEFFVNYENCMTQRTYAFDGVCRADCATCTRRAALGRRDQQVGRFTDPLTRAMPLFATAVPWSAATPRPMPSPIRRRCWRPRAAWACRRKPVSMWATTNATSWPVWPPACRRWPRPMATWATTADTGSLGGGCGD